MAVHTRYADIPVTVSKDTSLVRELMHPRIHGATRLSVAEITLPPGKKTLRHYHKELEEIVFVTHGEGVLNVGNERVKLAVGDTYCLRTGVEFNFENPSKVDFKFVASCSPPWCAEKDVMADEAL